jgi:SAM-dependent methyltransferase
VSGEQPKLYTSMAGWFHLLTRPEEYAEEAEFYRRAIVSAATGTPHTLLELGCGGGNNASHMKAHFQITLTDISPDMLSLCRSINPECEHLLGDMRTLRLGRVFDAVFIHDAVGYLTTRTELSQAMETAWIHCRPGGVAVFAPDYVRETFKPNTSHGGHDGATRGMRYLEWIWDPDPSDDNYLADYAYLLRDEAGELRVETDRHRLGLFRRSEWLDALRETGFEPSAIPFHHAEFEPGVTGVFLGVRSQ